ncbi:MAG: sensor histidine kinase [Betaproteobacteria bacterium]
MSVTMLERKTAPQSLRGERESGEQHVAQDVDATLATRYRESLRSFLADGSEASLSRGYELARQALVDDCGVLELAEIHHLALRRLSAESPPDARTLRAAGDFFAECLAPFEMSHRGAQEGARALRHLNEVLEGELRRVAQVLHDEAGQLLASVHIAVADIASELPPKQRGRFKMVGGLLTQIEAGLRNLSHEWRPTVLDNLGLLPALEFLGEQIARRTGIGVSVIGDDGARLPTTVESALYRIVQEALNNAVKHAAAGSVHIELRRLPAGVRCSIRDNGKGFDANRQPQGLGLTGIRERVSTLGGALRIITGPLNGTTIQADIPLGD